MGMEYNHYLLVTNYVSVGVTNNYFPLAKSDARQGPTS